MMSTLYTRVHAGTLLASIEKDSGWDRTRDVMLLERERSIDMLRRVSFVQNIYAFI